MILSKKVKIKISNNGKYWKKFNKYGKCKQRDVITVLVSELPKNSNKKVSVKCDVCSKKWIMSFQVINKMKDIHRCYSCNRKHIGKTMNLVNTIKATKERIGSKHPRWNYNKKEYREYHRYVTRETHKNDLTKLKNWEKRGKAGIEGAYQLDHLISIKFGFDNNIAPEIIGNIDNLKMITWENNYIKRHRCDFESIIRKDLRL